MPGRGSPSAAHPRILRLPRGAGRAIILSICVMSNRCTESVLVRNRRARIVGLRRTGPLSNLGDTAMKTVLACAVVDLALQEKPPASPPDPEIRRDVIFGKGGSRDLRMHLVGPKSPP